MPKTLCLTGSRPKKLCGYQKEKYKEFIKELEKILEEYYVSQDVRTVITGGAQGLDQLGFWAAYHVKKKCPDLNLKVYVPFRGQERVWSKYGIFSQKEYQQMLGCADEIHYVWDFSPETTSGCIQALMERNEAMVNDSDMVLALQNEKNWKTAPNGGTAKCMQYAWRLCRPIKVMEYGTNPYLMITKITEV